MASLSPFKQIAVACAIFICSMPGFVNIALGFQGLSNADYEYIWIQKQKETFKITNNKDKITKFDLALKESQPSIDKRTTVCPGPRLDLDNLQADEMGTLSYCIFEVVSIVDEQNVILQCGKNDIWLTGYNTKDLTDDRKVTVVDPVKVLEPKSFTTVLGAKRTIKAVKLTSEEEYIPFLKVFLEEQEKRKYEKLTLKNGTTISAKIVSIDTKKNRVTFKLDDGSEKVLVPSAFDKETAAKLKAKIEEYKEKNKGK